jgi:ATP adenylyltransferase
MSGEAGHLAPGTLWPAVLERTRLALAMHALQPIDTVQKVVEDCGVRFIVRSVSSLARKNRARIDADRINPLLPYEPELFVAEVAQTHVVLLNKYPVITHHLLIVTREFEDQENLLTRRDFVALAACMAQIDGVAFYNGGAAAGASQPHKHLQIAPSAPAPDSPGIPIEPLLARAKPDGRPGRVPGLPFLHGFVRLDPALFNDPGCASEVLAEHYKSLCAAAGIEGRGEGGALRQSAPYNLLLTRAWMMLIPRACESVEGISVNALGFAGSLFVRDATQLQVVEERGPMAILRAVTLPLKT